MPELTLIQGELQTQTMTAIWQLGGGTVEQVRSGPPTGWPSSSCKSGVCEKPAPVGASCARSRGERKWKPWRASGGVGTPS